MDTWASLIKRLYMEKTTFTDSMLNKAFYLIPIMVIPIIGKLINYTLITYFSDYRERVFFKLAAWLFMSPVETYISIYWWILIFHLSITWLLYLSYRHNQNS